jgi:hypothetical protein
MIASMIICVAANWSSSWSNRRSHSSYVSGVLKYGELCDAGGECDKVAFAPESQNWRVYKMWGAMMVTICQIAHPYFWPLGRPIHIPAVCTDCFGDSTLVRSPYAASPSIDVNSFWYFIDLSMTHHLISLISIL